MKLWKTLLPVATIGATAACIVPMASCSKTFLSTNAFDYKPDGQHPETTIKNLEEYKALVKDYFGETKHFAQDIAYASVENHASYKAELQKQKDRGDIEDFEYTFNFSIKDYSLAEKTYDFGEPYGKVDGYNLCITVTESTYEKVAHKENTVTHNKTTVTTDVVNTFTYTNAFVAMDASSLTYATIRLFALPDTVTSWTTTGGATYTTETYNTETKKASRFSNSTSGDSTSTYDHQLVSLDDSKETTRCYYLKNVKFNIA